MFVVLKSWPRSYNHVLLLQRTGFWFLEPMLYISQLPVTPAPEASNTPIGTCTQVQIPTQRHAHGHARVLCVHAHMRTRYVKMHLHVLY